MDQWEKRLEDKRWIRLNENCFVKIFGEDTDTPADINDQPLGEAIRLIKHTPINWRIEINVLDTAEGTYGWKFVALYSSFATAVTAVTGDIG